MPIACSHGSARAGVGKDFREGFQGYLRALISFWEWTGIGKLSVIAGVCGTKAGAPSFRALCERVGIPNLSFVGLSLSRLKSVVPTLRKKREGRGTLIRNGVHKHRTKMSIRLSKSDVITYLSNKLT